MAKAYKYKRGNVWYARFVGKTGKRTKLSLKTSSKDIANQKLARLVDTLEKEELGWQLTPKPLEAYLKEYLGLCEAEHSSRTLRLEKQALREFVGYCGVKYLHQITTGSIEAYKVRRSKEVESSTVNRTIAIIKAFLSRAIKLGYIQKNPAEYIKRLREKQKPIKHLSDDEVHKFLSVCSPRVRQIVTVFLLTGMRLGELGHMRWKDVDFRRGLIHIQNQGDWITKNYKPRVVPMHDVVREIFESLAKGKPQSYIFSTQSGNTIEGYFRAEVLRYSKKSGVYTNVKMFRATFASNLAMSGVDIYTIAELLGHHDVKITKKHYAHLTPNFLGQSVSKLGAPKQLAA